MEEVEGPRAIPDSQRVRLQREPEMDSNAVLPSWLLRAGTARGPVAVQRALAGSGRAILLEICARLWLC